MTGVRKPRYLVFYVFIVALLWFSVSVFAYDEDGHESIDPVSFDILFGHSHESVAGQNRSPRAVGVTEVGKVVLGGFTADLWVHDKYAYVGSYGYSLQCPSLGVRIVDVKNPENPSLVTSVASIAGATSEDVVVKRISTKYFNGDLLVTGIQACDRLTENPSVRGVDIWDVSDPTHPQHLAMWSSGAVASGVHELDLIQRGNKAYVLAAVPRSDREGKGSFRIVDVTDPENPVEIADWAAIEDGGLQIPSGKTLSDVYCHSAVGDKSGTRAILSHWDFGVIVLDISDPSNPVMIGNPNEPRSKENMHTSLLARGDTVLLTAQEFGFPFGVNGWVMRTWDFRDPSDPQYLGQYPAGPEDFFGDVGTFNNTIHNLFVRGSTVYASWYGDGVVLIDISQPEAPRRIGQFIPPCVTDPYGVLDPCEGFWGVYVDEDYIYNSQMNEGLYILRRTEP